MVERKIEQLEREKRRKIIIVEGLQEVEEKSSPEAIEELFQDLKIDLDAIVCDRIYRRGKNPPGTSDGPEVGDAKASKHAGATIPPIVVGFKENKGFQASEK